VFGEVEDGGLFAAPGAIAAGSVVVSSADPAAQTVDGDVEVLCRVFDRRPAATRETAA